MFYGIGCTRKKRLAIVSTLNDPNENGREEESIKSLPFSGTLSVHYGLLGENNT